MNTRKRRMALLLLLVMMMCACAQAEEAVRLPYGNDKYETIPQTVVVDVSAECVNTVHTGLFGGNTSWVDGGYGLYNVDTMEFDEAALQKLRESGVTHVRLPGGIEGDFFHWYEAVGDVETRVPQINCFSSEWPCNDPVNGVAYPPVFGPDEWFELCKKTGTALTVQLNTGTGTPQEAADFVRYCLDSGVEIESIAVGNEACLHNRELVDGIVVAMTAEAYIDFYLQTWELMGEETRAELKARGIPFGCIGAPDGMTYDTCLGWDEAVLTAIAGKTDFIDIHIGYAPGASGKGKEAEDVVRCLIGAGKNVRNLLDEEEETIARCAPGTAIRISEFGPLGNDYGFGMPGVVFMSSFFNYAINDPAMIGADYLPLTNHYAANNLIGIMRIEGGTNIYWDNLVTFIFRMYSEQVGRQVLRTAVSNAGTFDTIRLGLIPVLTDVPEMEAAVCFDPETGCGSVILTSLAYEQNTTVQVNLPFDQVNITAVTELSNENLLTRNYYTGRIYRVSPKAHEEACGVCEGSFTATIKPVSVLKIDFELMP